MSRAFSALALLGLAALSSCTTVENDPTTNSAAALYRTRVDFIPPTRAERIAQIAYEDVVFSEKQASLEAKMESLRQERAVLVAGLAAKFPECRAQKHCLSFSTKGEERRFEEFREARAVLGRVDAELGEAEATLELWRRRRDLRVRAIYNRYLVRQVLEAGKRSEGVSEVLVHSAEAFPDRQSLSRRLIFLAGPEIVPMLVGDLDFQMGKKPIDEAAILLTLDVRLRQGGRYLSALLVNTHQLDPQFYEEGFQRIWAKKLAQPEILREETYCGIYSIASPMLLAKLGSGKARPCGEKRGAAQSMEAARPDGWIVPASYRSL